MGPQRYALACCIFNRESGAAVGAKTGMALINRGEILAVQPEAAAAGSK